MPDRNSNDSMSTNDLNTPLLAEEILEKEVKPVAQEQSSSIAAASWLWLAQIALLFTSMSILVYAAKLQSHQPQNCTQKLSSYSPALSILTDDLRTVRMDSSYKARSPYRGPPNPSVDAAWDKIIRMGPMSISPTDFKKLNASKHSVKLPPESGGGYMGLPEFVHDIHCLNILWKQSYPEYYAAQQDWMKRDPEEWREHMDHCAESLRQKIMCQPNMGIITYNWIKGKKIPMANFNVQHKCRDFEGILDWALEEQAKAPEGGSVMRPEIEEVVEFVEPPFNIYADE